MSSAARARCSGLLGDVGRCVGGRQRIRDAPHDAGQVARDAGIRLLRIAPEERHDDERVGASYKKVYQDMLMNPVDLSQYAPDAIALHRGLGAAARRKTNLKRNVVAGGLARDDPVQEPDAPGGFRVHVGPAAVEERPDEPLPLEPMRAREGVAPIGRGLAATLLFRHESGYSGFPELLLLTDTFLRPFLRRRLITFWPFFDFMRLRKPCLFLRFRRLGW